MPKYVVEIPITGYVVAEVEAGSEQEAIDAAFEKPYHTSDIEEWELHEKVCEGNVLYAVRSGIDVYETD